MNSTLRLLTLLCFAALSQPSSLDAQPCNLCGTTASEWIAGITIDGGSGFLNPPGGGFGGCVDQVLFDAYVAILKKGVSHSFTLTPGFSGAAQSEYWKIWIDLNHDGDLDDSGDLVYTSSSGSTTTVSGSFFIPLSVNTGASRIRVAMRRGSPPPDCGNYTNGQELTYSSAYIDECDISFTNACAREYIKQVNISTINNATSCGASGYQNFTNISTTLNAGNAYPVQLTPGFFNAGQHPERWLIWIDFNNDYDFDDPGEQVFDSGVVGSTTITNGTMTIPSSAQTATARMRIKMIPTDVNTVTLDPCDPVPSLWFQPDQYGEAEDYTINIKGVTLEVQGGSAEDLVKDVLFGGNCFDLKNVTYSGQSDQIGSFTNGLTNVGFNTGLILATGGIGVAPGPNDSDGASAGYGILTPDADLMTLANGALYDMADIEFDFTPTQSPFTFEFVFASEEYCEYVNTQFNDVFGFFISGPGIAGTQNLAVVPSTATPVTINTVNHLVNSGLYTHNTPASGNNCANIPPATGPAVSGLQYDGFTKKFTAVANVIPCATYHIKFKIADVGDGVWDSAVFLKGGANSGGNASIDWLVNGQTGVDVVTEGCGTVGLLIDRLGTNTTLPLPVSFTIAGTATNGSDYGPISTTYVIPAGTDQITIPVNMLNDLIPEGSETVVLTLNNACSCLNPQEILTILDYKAMTLDADTVSIPGPGMATVGVTVAGGVAPYTYQWDIGGNAPTISPFVAIPTTYTVTVTDACGKTSTAKARVNIGQSPWPITPTGRNHTIIIPVALQSDVFGQSLQMGDRIGVFYDSSGTGILKCGGFVAWQGQSTSFAAYGNDATPPARNGFNTGELFKIKIWRSASNQIFDATAQYAPVGSLGGLVTHTNAFADDGISMLSSIIAGTTHAITLNSGWNLISSYIIPTHPDMLQVFAPIATSIDIVKNCDGDSYIPLLMINGIGNWNLLEGYPVKANQKDTLLVIGQKAVPEANPIPLIAGWNCIGYLRDSPQNIDTVFKFIKVQISLVKNNEGKVYSPQFGINQIGNMIPGQGYKVKALSNVTLSYRPNFTGGPLAERTENKGEADMHHFVLDSNLNTGNNATIILMPSIADSVIHSGDEIGIFTPSGLLCGTAMYQGENLAITVWGDDPSTSGIIEGMQVGEP
ncbi:MAG: choice-of-anchor L domain-containing protein, partial [Phycisphaerae bacterium]|nr:choice-of-anchor L domain-containing protein [Saprospiraceae bacterium]